MSGISIAAIAATLRRSTESAIDSDRASPGEYPQLASLRRNPYALPSQNDGAVDAAEALSTRDSLAVDLQSAAAHIAGQPYVASARGGGWSQELQPASSVSYAQLRGITVHAEAILRRLADSDGRITEADLSRLPEAIKAHFAQQGNIRLATQTHPVFQERVERLIRAAIAAAAPAV